VHCWGGRSIRDSQVKKELTRAEHALEDLGLLPGSLVVVSAGWLTHRCCQREVRMGQRGEPELSVGIARLAPESNERAADRPAASEGAVRRHGGADMVLRQVSLAPPLSEKHIGPSQP
jgi:hypothetical protein